MSEAARSAVVTGGAGFVGSHLADRLVSEGHRVRILDDFSSGREANLDGPAGGAELVRGDLRDPDTLARVLDGADWVFHQGAVPSVPRSVREPERTNDVNINGTLRLLEAARRAGVSRVVFAASSSAYGNTAELPKVETMPPTPLSPYALQKFAGETYCRLYHELYGLETVALRYFNIYGPRQDPKSEYAAVIPNFITATLEGRPARINGDGEQTRDFTFVADAIAANLAAATSETAPGHVINVAGGRRVSLNELLGEIQSICGQGVPAEHGPPRAGDVQDSLADLGRARDLLAYVPRTDLRAGLEQTVAFFGGPGGA